MNATRLVRPLALLSLLLSFMLLVSGSAAGARERPTRDGVVKVNCGPVTAELYKVHCRYGTVAYEVDPENPARAREQATRYGEWLFGLDGLVDSMLKEWSEKEWEHAERVKVGKQQARSAAERREAEELALRILDKPIGTQVAKARKRAARREDPWFALGARFARPIHFQMFETREIYLGISLDPCNYEGCPTGVSRNLRVPEGGKSLLADTSLTPTDLVNRIQLANLVAQSVMMMYGTHAGIRMDLTGNFVEHWLFKNMENYYGRGFVDPKLGIDIWEGSHWYGTPAMLDTLGRGPARPHARAMFRYMREHRTDVFYRLLSIVTGNGETADAPTIRTETFRTILGAEDQQVWDEFMEKFRAWMRDELRGNEREFEKLSETYKTGTARRD